MKASQRSILRTAGVAGAAAVMLVGGTGAAFAHECYVASRSDQGDAMAGTRSAAWETVTIEQIVTQFLGQTAEVAECVAESAPDAGVPTSFVFGAKQAQGQGGVIAENNPVLDTKGLSSDGTGIDHAEVAYGDVIVGLILQCGGTLPPPGS
ncbi:MAG TPA: hypothetical protein VF049_09110 [Nocardioidaceae bacterium]|jgi:hypothetical protein